MKIQIRTAMGYMRRSPFQAMAAVFILTLTFFVATLVATLVYSSSKVLKYFETRPQVIAFLKDDAKEENIAEFQHKLSNDMRIKEVKYVSREEALSIYKKATSDNPLLGELVSPSIFPASLEFSVNDLSFAQNVIDEVKVENVVESVGFTAAIGGNTNLTDVVGRLRKITTYVRVGGGVFTGVLTLTSFFVLLITISLRMSSRREEIEILNLIGATPKFIRSPIILEALIYALIGVVLGWTFSFISILYLTPHIVSYFGEIPVLPKDALTLLTLFGIILVIELVLGVFLSLSGTILAISRVKKVR